MSCSANIVVNVVCIASVAGVVAIAVLIILATTVALTTITVGILPLLLLQHRNIADH